MRRDDKTGRIIATPADERFWSGVEKRGVNECWPWKMSRDKDGYGLLVAAGESRAHRVSAKLHGLNPDGRFVCHSCDNPPCCNPSHLFLGDALANAADAVKKGRYSAGDSHYARTSPEKLARGDRHGSKLHPNAVPRGDRHGSKTKPESIRRGDQHWTKSKPERLARGEHAGGAKLSNVQAAELLGRFLTGEKRQALADAFGISLRHVYEIGAKCGA